MTLQPRPAPPVPVAALSPVQDALDRQRREAPLTQEQYEAVKGYWLRSHRPNAWRNVLLLMLMRNTGFRPSEIVRPQKASPRQHFGETAYLRAGQIEQHGPMYIVSVLRAKKRERPDFEAVYLSPVLGRPLVEYIRGNNLKETDPLFPINTRQLANVWYEACDAALGYRKEPTSLRDLYVVTVARIANEIVGYTPWDMGVASKMVGHTETRITRTFYEKLTPEQRRAIQEQMRV